MTRPIIAPDWATGGNYPAGGNPWSGQPVRSTPSGGKVLTGYTPGTNDAAEEDNSIIGTHGDWINWFESLFLGSQFFMVDDFLGTVVSTFWVSATSLTANYNDSANGGIGAVRMTVGSAGLNSVAMGLATNDFEYNARVRCPTTTTAGAIFGIGGGPCLYWNASVSANWYYSTNGGSSGTSTGVAVSSAYQMVTVRRTGTVLTFYIDGVLVHTTTGYTTNLNGFALNAITLSGGTGIDVIVDYVKFWADR